MPGDVPADQAPDAGAERREAERGTGEGNRAGHLANEPPAERELPLQHRLVEPIDAADEQDRGQYGGDRGQPRLAEERGEHGRQCEQHHREERTGGEQEREDRPLRPRVEVAGARSARRRATDPTAR